MKTMTDYSKMSNEELQVKAAEVMGWSGPGGLDACRDSTTVMGSPHERCDSKEDAFAIALEWHAADKEGFDRPTVYPMGFDPIYDANDLRRFRLWLWREHQIHTTLWREKGYTLVEAHHSSTLYKRAVVSMEHDDDDASIIEAEGRATLIAGLKALDAKGGGE